MAEIINLMDIYDPECSTIEGTLRAKGIIL